MKYPHQHAEKPGRGDWVIAGGLLVELLSPLFPVRTAYGDKRHEWVGIAVDGNLVEVELVQPVENQKLWEVFYVQSAVGGYLEADAAQIAVLFGEEP